jgi:hypothetical protein
MKRTFFLVVVAALAAGCIHHQPLYEKGSIVQHVTSGRTGQVIDWWCRSSAPCQYLVRFPLQDAMTESSGSSFMGVGNSGGFGIGRSSEYPRMFAEEYLFEFELKPMAAESGNRKAREEKTAPWSCKYGLLLPGERLRRFQS